MVLQSRNDQNILKQEHCQQHHWLQIQFFTITAKLSPSYISQFKQMETKTEVRVEDKLRIPLVLLTIVITWSGLLPEDHEGLSIQLSAYFSNIFIRGYRTKISNQRKTVSWRALKLCEFQVRWTSSMFYHALLRYRKSGNSRNELKYGVGSVDEAFEKFRKCSYRKKLKKQIILYGNC